MAKQITKDDILDKLETIYRRALKGDKWYTALQAAALQGRNIGMFERKRLPEVTRIEDMNEEQLREFLAILEKFDPTLKNQEREAQENPLRKGSDWAHPKYKHSPPCACIECC